MKITGQIFDENMKFLGDANVEVVGENRNTSADGDGYFEIEVNSVNSQLRFSHASKDYDVISVSDFQNNGSYWQLYSSQLPEVSVTNNSKPKSCSILFWVLAIGITVALIASSSKKNIKKVTV